MPESPDYLDELDPDALTPREALDALYRLKALRPELAPVAGPDGEPGPNLAAGEVR